MSNEGPNQPLNWQTIGALATYEDDAVRALFGEVGAQMRDEDIQNVRGFAMDLAASATERKSPEELLKRAMKESRKIGGEMVKDLSDEELRDMVKLWSGKTLSDEEIASFRMSMLGLDDWLHERAKAKENVTIEPMNLAVDRDDTVVTQDSTHEGALRRAQKEQGKQV